MKTPSREETLFQAAAALTGLERATFLDRECAGDPELRARLDALLDAHAQSDGVLDSHTEATRPTITLDLPDLPDPAVGITIGRYKLLEKLGEGGCGVVYVAEQTEPVRRRVALKVIKLGMDTKQVVARFEAERQALAMMDHPNIAKVLDAGATEAGISQIPNQQAEIPTGRPYFVMELVRGIPITDYCDQNKLSTKERLDLFIKVCQAIQHAHQKGIIHRDVKPSNILVTLHDGVPVPKVIDFGIAKATQGKLTDATVYTQLHQFIGTPAYMSPEQAEMSGLDIDTRSDIYSLGVLLYELLTGATPFDGKELMASGLDAMRKTIREQEPVRPSTRLRQTEAAVASGASRSAARHAKPANDDAQSPIDSDLDWIVMKCLEKDRARRYETANGLAMDLSRHLNNEPVIARPPSAVYRFQKAFRRNKLAFAAAVVVMTALVSGIGVATWRTVQTGYAQRETEAALQRETAALAEVSRAKEALEEALRTAQRTTYIRGIALVHQEWLAGNVARAQTLLEECGPEELRDFEWHYLRGLCQGQGSQKVRGHLDAQRIAYSLDGKRKITSEGATVLSVWDTTSGAKTLAVEVTENEGFSLGFALSPDGRHVALPGGSKGGVRIVDLETGNETRTFYGHTDSIKCLAYSTDGQLFAAGSKMGIVRVWETTTSRQLRLYRHAGPISAVGFSADSCRLLVGDETLPNEYIMWDLDTSQEVKELHDPKHKPWTVAFSSDQQLLATTFDDGAVALWDLVNDRMFLTLSDHHGPVYGAAFSPSDHRLATAAKDKSVRIWNRRTGELLHTLTDHQSQVSTVAYSPDGNLLASAGVDGTVKVRNGHSGEILLEFLGHKGTNSIHSIATTVVFSPNGQEIASAGYDRHVRIWNPTNGEQRLALVHKGRVYCVAYRSDGQVIVTCSEAGEVRLWSAESGEEILNVRSQLKHCRGVAFTPNGQRVATTTLDGGIRIFDAVSGLEVLALPGGYNGVAFSPDGRLLAAGGSEGGVRLWGWTPPPLDESFQE